jgi:hypothetical protein
MNRTLKRPMFRIGGSAGTGITSGLDQPRKQYANGTGKPSFEDYLKERGMIEKRENLERLMREYKEDMRRKDVKEQKTMAADGGRIGYQQGSMPNFQFGGVPGFLTNFGLNLLATPPAGNIFQTAGIAAKEPFNQLQVSQARARELQSERDFLRGETDRKLTAADKRLDKELDFKREELNMRDDANVMAYAEVFKDNNGSPNLIKGQNAVDFFKTKYNELTIDFGVESVSVEPIDVTLYQSQKNIKKFRKANPGAEGKVFFDVASGKGVKLVKDVETGDLKFIPADSSEIDTSGEDMPEPNEDKSNFEETFKPGLTGTDQFIVDTINEAKEKRRKGMEEVPNFNIYR